MPEQPLTKSDVLLLSRILEQAAQPPEDIVSAGAPAAPMGTEPPEFYSDVANAGLGAMQAPITITPQMAIANALAKKRQEK